MGPCGCELIMPTNLTNYVRQINGPLFEGTLSRGNTWGINATTVIDYYVDTVNGNDNNPGTRTLPLQSLAELDARIPTTCVSASYRGHLKAGTYVMPGNNVFLRARLFMGGLIEIFADEAWDPTVYTVFASGTAGGGTSATVIVGSGFTANAFKGKTIRVTSGPAAGQYRRVNRNTTTQIFVNGGFLTAPASGASWEMLDLAVILQAPPQSVAQDSLNTYLLVDASCGGKVLDGSLDYATGSGALGNALVSAGTCFRGVRFAIDPSVFALAVLGDSVFFYGCEVDSDAPVAFIGAKANFGTGQPLRELECWGLLIQGISWLSNAAQVYGYCSFAFDLFQVRDPNARVTLAGGYCARINTFTAGNLIVLGDFTVPYEIGEVGVSAIQANGGTLNIQNTTILGDAGIEIATDTTLLLGRTVTGVFPGNNALSASGASRVICFDGAPQLGDAVADDWVVFGAPAFNKADLANVGDAVLGTDGSLATRGD